MRISCHRHTNTSGYDPYKPAESGFGHRLLRQPVFLVDHLLVTASLLDEHVCRRRLLVVILGCQRAADV